MSRVFECYAGIDLGSTTTKAVVLDGESRVLGRGITNSRSNYDVACAVALCEAMTNARFALLEQELVAGGMKPERRAALLKRLLLAFRRQQYLAQLATLGQCIEVSLERDRRTGLREAAQSILARMHEESAALWAEDAGRKSDFFRDLAGSRWQQLAEQVARDGGPAFDALVGVFDKSILEVENTLPLDDAFATQIAVASREVAAGDALLTAAVDRLRQVELVRVASVGTGYGRQRLPFPKEQIRSEILCHGLGAHVMFPGTRTVLDIGGQDTKAIQVDARGIVTSFQMNDRCAAGCGRYLGYIADEMNLGLHELGPLAQQARKTVRINSTCTVFAGAELRERMSLGEKREDILAGLHRAIILRAMSLLARSGGVADQFTFTGGVAKNPAAVEALRRLVGENYGQLVLNISPESIYTGALGAATFARRGALEAAAVGGET